MGKQKRSENTYQKIDTIFKRDVNNIIMPYDSFISDELEWLRGCKFDAEEKIDGTNMRIEVTSNVTYNDTQISNTEFETNYNWPLWVDWTVTIKGKTDNASIPKNLESYMKKTFTPEKVLAALGLKSRMYLSNYIIDKIDNMHFSETEAHQDAIDHKWVVLDDKGQPTTKLDISKMPTKYTLYGEGYGAGIQKGGYYRSDNSYIGFDVKVDEMYLLRENRDEIFTKLGCDIVPFIGQFTIDEAIEYVKKGFNSNIAEDTHFAEGLVCRTPMGLKNRRGDRIIFKVKTCDWKKYFDKYGTYDRVEQEPNTHYLTFSWG